MSGAIGNNAGFLPRVTSGLIVGYSRNPKDFSVNLLTKLTPVDRQIGRFPKLRPQEASRLLSTDYRRWADGANRPVSDFNKDHWLWLTYNTTRYAESIPLGYLGLEQADFPVQEAQAQSMAMRAMLARTRDFYTILTTAGSYLSTHTDTATNFGGGLWANATVSNRFIQRTIQEVVTRVEVATNGAVSGDSLTMIMSPRVAYRIAATSEIAETLIQSQWSREQLEFSKYHINYGLPPKLYGVNIVVDKTIETTTAPNVSNTATSNYIVGSNEVYFVCRPGDLVNESAVATDFATIHTFVYKGEEMLSEVIDDPFNKRKVLSVTDNYQHLLTANETLARVTNVLS